KGDKVYINDPGRGSYTLSMEEFSKGFTGIALLFNPTETFEPSGKKKSMLGYTLQRLSSTKSAVLLMALTALLCSFMQVVTPGFSRIFIDRLLSGENPEWLVPFTLAFTVVALIHVIASWINAIYSYRLSIKFDFIGSSSFFWKLLHLPMEFFSQRMAGDLQMRQQAKSQEAKTLMDTVTPLLLNTVLLILYLVVMVRTSLLLTFVGLLSLVLNLLVGSYISRRRVNVTRVMMRDQARLGAAEIAGIEMIESIKASGAEDGYFAKWAGYQASVNTSSVHFLKLNQYLGAIPPLVSSLTGAVVLLLGVLLTIEGKLTSGMILAFQGYLTAFQRPATQLLDSGQQIQEFRSQMERTQDVMEYPSDVKDDAPLEEDKEYNKLSGHVELKYVTFGYSRLAEPIIKDFSLSLEPGQSVALVG
ncbi:MAG: hypothetical protein KBS81_05375, partial [Spirochaetales bacterium]|nr:hypothetical protein [Candidatus Physcosoma equi]